MIKLIEVSAELGAEGVDEVELAVEEEGAILVSVGGFYLHLHIPKTWHQVVSFSFQSQFLVSILKEE